MVNVSRYRMWSSKTSDFDHQTSEMMVLSERYKKMYWSVHDRFRLAVCYQFDPPSLMSPHFALLLSHLQLLLKPHDPAFIAESHNSFDFLFFTFPTSTFLFLLVTLRIKTIRAALSRPRKSLTIAMDEETAKEVEDLQNNLRTFLHRKRKREETALEDENKHLKDENERLKKESTNLKDENTHFRDEHKNLDDEIRDPKNENTELKDEIEHLKQRLTSSVQRCSQANERLAEEKQSYLKLYKENESLKLDLMQETKSKLPHKHVCGTRREEIEKHGRRIEVLEEAVHLLKVENQSLQTRLGDLEKYEHTSKKAVSDLKAKLRLAIDAEFDG